MENDEVPFTAENVHPTKDDSLLHPIQQVYFRAGLIACREYVARFVEAESPSIAMSIRANWWPSLGPDFGPPRQLDFAEVTSGEYGTPEFKINTADKVSPTQEALPIALGFLQLVGSGHPSPEVSASTVGLSVESQIQSYEAARHEAERCEGRYPVPGPRDEPFDVTYRCYLPEGHEGPHSGGYHEVSASAVGARTLADYRPQHDEDCDSHRCVACGGHFDGRLITGCICGGSLRAIRKSCSCGLEALLHASAPAPQWQSIASAPKDGRTVMLFYQRDNAAGIAEMGNYRRAIKVGTKNLEGWRYLRSHSAQYDLDHPPTHWMPLPATQAAKGGMTDDD